MDISCLNKLNFPYNGLTFTTNKELFTLADAKKYHIFISVDLGEGLGHDYSVINIFRLLPKTKEEIEIYRNKLNDKYDYFKLEQIGVFKSNIYSVNDIAHILYLITFELFDSEKARIVLERNTYGDELLANCPHVFNDNNEFSNHVFIRYKHRIEEKTTKMGLKINNNKKLLIKDYQNYTKNGNIIIHDTYTLNEIRTFTKHETATGDITFKSESGHDDCIMTCVILSSVFNTLVYKDFIDELIVNMKDFMDNSIPSFLTTYKDDKPDLNSFIGGYKKIYNNGMNRTTNPNLPYNLRKKLI
jgi:hypothetical protein